MNFTSLTRPQAPCSEIQATFYSDKNELLFSGEKDFACILQQTLLSSSHIQMLPSYFFFHPLFPSASPFPLCQECVCRGARKRGCNSLTQITSCIFRFSEGLFFTSSFLHFQVNLICIPFIYFLFIFSFLLWIDFRFSPIHTCHHRQWYPSSPWATLEHWSSS